MLHSDDRRTNFDFMNSTIIMLAQLNIRHERRECNQRFIVPQDCHHGLFIHKVFQTENRISISKVNRFISTSVNLQQWVSELVYLTTIILNSQGLMSDGRAPGNEMKDESAPHLNTPGFEPRTQWSEIECSTAQPSASRDFATGRCQSLRFNSPLHSLRASPQRVREEIFFQTLRIS